MQTQKCQVCRKEYSPDCDFQQGRCPLHPPLIKIKVWHEYNILRQLSNIYSSTKFTFIELAVIAAITLYLTWVLFSAIIMK